MQFATESPDHSLVHISTKRSVHWSPVLGHICRHETLDTMLHLHSPFVIYSSDDVITASPPLAESRCILPSPHISPVPSPAQISRFTKFAGPLDCACLTLSCLLLSVYKTLWNRYNAHNISPRFVISSCRTVIQVRLGYVTAFYNPYTDCFLGGRLR
jgi:hypothetical protein